jgi:hypothetical protein
MLISGSQPKLLEGFDDLSPNDQRGITTSTAVPA